MDERPTDYRPRTEAPVNPLPPVVVALAVLIAGIEAMFSLAERGILGGRQGVGWRVNAIQDHGAYDALIERMWALGTAPAEDLLRLLAYPFLHFGFTHALMAVVLILALGKIVGESFRPLSVLAVWVVSSVAGALVWSASVDTDAPLFGAYPAVYGLVGAFTFMLWARLNGLGAKRLRAFTLIGALLVFQLVFGLLFGGGYDWIADISGFVAGFLLSFLVSPGGWRATLERLRQR